MKYLVIAVTSLFLSYSAAQAQFSLNGSAVKIADSTYQLTPKTSGKSGAIWDSTKLAINQKFDISFNLRFGCDNAGGKGIAFVLQDDAGALNEIATDAESMGYQGAIQNSMAIEFDTENDGVSNEVGYDHVAVHINGQQGSPLVSPVGIYNDKRNVEDCGLHRVRVTYSHAITLLSVYVDCGLVFQKSVDLVNDVFFGTKEVYMGFTSSNGTGGNPHLVEYLGTTKDLTLNLDLSNICPDTLVLGNNSIRQEFSDFKWTLIKGSTRLDSIYKYKALWGAPSLGNYKVELEALRTCDSNVVRSTNTVEAIDSVETIFSIDVDTTCTEYKFRINTGCYNCDELQWDFKDQKAAWGVPKQVLNLTKNQDFRGYFRADTRQGHCFDSDSQFFNLYILNTSAPELWLSTDTLCGGEELEVRDSVSGMDSLVFNFTKGFFIPAQRGNSFKVYPDGFGKMAIRRSIYYPNGCFYNDSFFVQVDTMPEAGFDVTDSTKNCDIVEYELEGKSDNASSIEWQTSIGNFTDEDLTLEVDTNLPLEIVLIVTNASCSDTLPYQVRPIIYYSPKVSFEADTTEGCTPLTVTFTWASDPLDSFYIDFDNGSDSLATGQNHTWTQVYTTGTYDIEYTTYSGEGMCENTVRLDEYIETYDSVVASIFFEQQNGCAPFRMNITDSSYLEGALYKEYFLSVREKDTFDFEEIFWTNDANRVLTEEGTYYVYYAVGNGFCRDTAAYEVEVRSLTKTDIPDLYGVTVNKKEQVELSWHPLSVASKYNIQRIDDYGDEVNFRAIKDTILIDSSVQADRASYTYTIIGADDCGSLSAASIPSKTILLEGEVNNLQEANMTWTSYEEFATGVLRYELTDLNQVLQSGAINEFKDERFYNRLKPDSGRCYRAVAYENGGDNYVSYSNTVCLNPIAQVYFPNAFSPFKGGLNDTFLWRGVGIKEANVAIFNRWGTKVYEGEGQWLGTFNDVQCPDGVYYYVATFTAANNRVFSKSGQLHLIR